MKLNKLEFMFWGISVIMLVISFLWSKSNLLYLFASIVGVTALIYLAKGEPRGQVLTILFSVLYGVISYKYRYYGEMMTYLGMTLPSALIAATIWYRHPFEKGKTVVKVSILSKKHILSLVLLTPIVAYVMYRLLAYLKTSELILSTVSVVTSFMASMLTIYRSKYYALFYAFNDIVLIALWILASMHDPSFLPMVLCFVIFLANDLYALFKWKILSDTQNRQKEVPLSR